MVLIKGNVRMRPEFKNCPRVMVQTWKLVKPNPKILWCKSPAQKLQLFTTKTKHVMLNKLIQQHTWCTQFYTKDKTNLTMRARNQEQSELNWFTYLHFIRELPSKYGTNYLTISEEYNDDIHEWWSDDISAVFFRSATGLRY